MFETLPDETEVRRWLKTKLVIEKANKDLSVIAMSRYLGCSRMMLYMLAGRYEKQPRKMTKKMYMRLAKFIVDYEAGVIGFNERKHMQGQHNLSFVVKHEEPRRRSVRMSVRIVDGDRS